MGPSVTVYLPELLTEGQTIEVDQLLASVSESFGGSVGKRDCWPRLAALGWVGADRPCLTHVYTMPADSQDDIGAMDMERWTTVLPFAPRHVVDVSAMCNDAKDHYAIVRIAILIARKYQGSIQFEAARLEDRARNAAGLVRGSDIEETPLPGSLLLCEEGTGVHLGDAIFMDAWSKHPLFNIY